MGELGSISRATFCAATHCFFNRIGGKPTFAATPRDFWWDAKADFPFLHCGREHNSQALALSDEVPNPLPNAFCFSFML